jgi:deoxyribonuclease-4
MSIAGGLYRALLRGYDLGCTTIQLFTRNATRWKANPLVPEEVSLFKRTRQTTGIDPLVAHGSYLVNLASPDAGILERSRDALIEEVRRAGQLGIPFLVIHPGSHRGTGEKTGLRRIVESFNRICAEADSSNVSILLETTAGQGNTVGYRFEHLKEIIDGVRWPSRFGVCLDTCHVFAAGYGLSSEAEYRRTFDEFDSILGLDLLRVIHVNDSAGGPGKRLDRHTHIGRGSIGIDAFRMLMKDERFSRVPKILETPKGKPGDQWDRRNLALLAELARK